MDLRPPLLDRRGPHHVITSYSIHYTRLYDIILSIFGVFLVKTREGADQKELLGALSKGINTSAALIVVASAGLLYLLHIDNPWGIWGAVVTGLVTGIVIGRSTEYYTSPSYAPTRRITSYNVCYTKLLRRGCRCGAGRAAPRRPPR